MSKLTINRRSLLRGALGTGIAIALPPLEAMVDSKRALAQGTPKKRFMTFFMGNGVPTLGYCHNSGSNVCTERWLPPNLGANFTLSESMQPLAPIKAFVRVMSGLKNPYHGDAHTANMGGVMTGFPIDSTTSESRMGGPTVDFLAAKTLSEGCRFRQLSILLAGANYNAVSRNTLTFGEGGAPVAATREPADLFNRLFQGFTPPMAGGAPQPDPELLRRKNILDFVHADAKKLSDRLGASDRQRLEQHLVAIEEVQRSIVTTSAAVTDECKVPGAPATAGDLRQKSRQLIDLIALAFACDMTRVVAYGPTGCNAENTLPWLYPGNLHDETSHAKIIDEPTVLERMAKVVAWQLGELAYLVSKLQAIKEGAGSLFDNTMIVTASEHGNSNNHSATDIPTVVVAGSQMGVAGNFHWRAPGAPTPSTGDAAGFSVTTSRLWLSVLQALGTGATKFGVDETGTVPLK